MVIKNLFIYGSCVSRDIFNLEESRVFRITDYYARSSMASLCSTPYLDTEALDRIPSAFRRRMVKNDFTKRLLAETDRLQAADVILIDLIDERFDLVVLPSGQMITRSNELDESGFLNGSEVRRYRVIPHGSDEHRKIWLKGVRTFLALLKTLNKLDCVIVNEVFWASRFDFETRTAFPVAAAVVEKANKELAWMYAALEKELDRNQFISFYPALLTADPEHRWGVSPFHYSEQYYQSALEQILVKAGLGKGSSAYCETQELIRAPRVSSGVRLTLDAYMAGEEIFAHCTLDRGGQACEGGDYAFYLMIDGVRHDMRWYEVSPNARFDRPGVLGELQVVAFYRDDLDEKLIAKSRVISEGEV